MLYGVVEEHLESFYRALAEQGTTLPAFVHASVSSATCAAAGSSTGKLSQTKYCPRTLQTSGLLS